MPNIPELKIGNTTYKLKDGDLRKDIILAKSTQPTEECNKIWVNEAASEEYEVPTYAEFEDLKSAFDKYYKVPLVANRCGTGYVRLSDGSIAVDNRFYYVKAEVSEGDIVIYNAASNAYASVLGIALYDESETWEGIAYPESNSNLHITIPSGVRFIKASFEKDLISSGSLYIIKSQFVRFRADQNTDGILGYINPSTGARTYDTRYKAVKAIVHPGEIIQYSFGASGGSTLGIAFYTKNRSFISGQGAKVYTNSIIVPKNAYYMRATIMLNIDGVQLEIVSTDDTIAEIEERVFTNANKLPKVVTVGHDTLSNYTSLLTALKSTDPDVKIILKGGTYNVFDEYESYYGSTFWDDYDGYADHYRTDPFYLGLWMAPGRQISGEVGAVIDCRYSGDNQYVKEKFSAIANAGNVVLENVTIKYGNIRYAIHDDMGPTEETVIFRNIHFIPESDNTAIGAGCGFKSFYFIDGCVFDDFAGINCDIRYHNNAGESTTNKCEIHVTNCFGHRACIFDSMGASTEMTECYVSNSKFKEIKAYPNGNVTNMHLIEWCNEVYEN